MLPTAALDYHLPESAIATAPADPRDAARLMVLRRSDPSFLAHARVRDLPEFLVAGDYLVLNKTRVLPARFLCSRADSGGAGEGLFVSEFPEGGDRPATGPLRWHILLKLRRTKPGVEINLLSSDGKRSGAWLKLVERIDAEGRLSPEGNAGWLVEVGLDRTWPESTTTYDVLLRTGLPPLPPYILSARKHQHFAPDAASDQDRYQTTFAAPDPDQSHGRGSVAAPTAGLHFTPELLEHLASRGVERGEVVLHVGMGTFKPVETEFVEQHPMHSEWCTVPATTAARLVDARGPQAPAPANDGRAPCVVAVGTTTARTLESMDSLHATPHGRAGQTRILITPGHHFRRVGAMMTNFHLPRSTLLAMVAAFLDDDDRVRGQGLPRLLEAYRIAIAERYRFYSFGDAMLILP